MKIRKPKVEIKVPRIDFERLADDFRNLNPNDPSVWPKAPKMALFVGLFLVVLAAGWWFFMDDQLQTLAAKEAELEQLKVQFVEKKRQAVNLDLHVQQLAEIDRSFGTLLRQLPSKSEVESLLIEINQAGLGRGLQFDLFKPNAEQVREFYAELPISVRILGGYHDFGAFAADVARLPRIVTLNNVVITPGKDGLLTMEAVTKTFRYLDEEEVAKQKKTTAGAKKS